MFEGKNGSNTRDADLERKIIQSSVEVDEEEKFASKVKVYLEKLKNHGDLADIDYLLKNDVNKIIEDKKGKLEKWQIDQLLGLRLEYMHNVDLDKDLTKELAKTKEAIKNLS